MHSYTWTLRIVPGTDQRSKHCVLCVFWSTVSSCQQPTSQSISVNLLFPWHSPSFPSRGESPNSSSSALAGKPPALHPFLQLRAFPVQSSYQAPFSPGCPYSSSTEMRQRLLVVGLQLCAKMPRLPLTVFFVPLLSHPSPKFPIRDHLATLLHAEWQNCFCSLMPLILGKSWNSHACSPCNSPISLGCVLFAWKRL